MLLPLLLMAFAVTQVNRWAADEQDGRLDLVLTTPQSRLWVLLGRFAALATATVAIGVITLLASALAAAATGLKLDSGNLAGATPGMSSPCWSPPSATWRQAGCVRRPTRASSASCW